MLVSKEMMSRHLFRMRMSIDRGCPSLRSKHQIQCQFSLFLGVLPSSNECYNRMFLLAVRSSYIVVFPLHLKVLLLTSHGLSVTPCSPFDLSSFARPMWKLAYTPISPVIHDILPAAVSRSPLRFYAESLGSRHNVNLTVWVERGMGKDIISNGCTN
jgi:hypothetical protein